MNQIKFETGATSAESNNLVLSVMNDGSVYNERIHAVKRLLQGKEPVRSFHEIVLAEASTQRQNYRLKFKPQAITEAAEIIQDQSIEHAIEMIRYKWEKQGKSCIFATCRRWLDRTYGNSYFSVSLMIAGNIVNIPMQYGYEEQWKYEVINLLEKLRFIPTIPRYENGNKQYGYMSEYEEKGIIRWEDQGYMLKKQMFNGIHL